MTGKLLACMVHRLRRRIITSMIVCLAVWLHGAAGSSADPTSYLPTGHRAYDFLGCMELHRFATGLHLGTKPLTRAEVARALFDIRSSATMLSPADREEFDALLDEFTPDYYPNASLAFDDHGPVKHLPGILGDTLYRNRRNFYAVSGDDYAVFFDLVAFQGAELGPAHGGDDDDVITGSHGFTLHGTLGDHLGYLVDLRDSRELGDRSYPENTATTLPGRGYVKFLGDAAEYDETNAHLAYSSGPVILSVGRGRPVWGRGERGTLALSGYGAPMNFLSFEAGFGRARFVFIAAELEQFPPIAQMYYPAQPSAVADSVTVQKRFSAHRLEVDITDDFSLGLYDMVIYGGRWELSYLNPVMFLKGAEHANGDHDNAAIGADFRWIVHRGHSVYGELFVDDISTTKLGTDWYGNKLAGQIGSFLVEPFGLPDVDARIEYTRIQPWVYTHRYPINTYTSYGDPLGYFLGPNSDDLSLEIRKRFGRRIETVVSIDRRRHGANPPGVNVGGDIADGFSQDDSKKAEFLAGDVTRTTAVSADISWEPLWNLVCRAGYTREIENGDGIDRIRLSLGLHEW